MSKLLKALKKRDTLLEYIEQLDFEIDEMDISDNQLFKDRIISNEKLSKLNEKLKVLLQSELEKLK